MHGFPNPRRVSSGYMLPLLIVLGLVMMGAGCARAAGTLSAQDDAAPTVVPAVALPTVEIPAASTSGGALAGVVPVGMLSYTGDVRAKSEVSVPAAGSGRIEEVRVKVGDRVQAGDVIAVLDTTVLDLQVAQAEAALEAARATLTKAEAGARPEQVKVAEAGVRAAEAALSLAARGPTEGQIAIAEHQLEQAKNGLWAAQSQRDGICGRVGRLAQQSDCDAAEAQAGGAWEGVQIAQQQLDELKKGAPWQQVQQAQAALDVATQQLELAKNPVTEEDLQAARAQVKMAEVSLDMAKKRRDDAIVTAPISGIVASRPAEVGAMAGGGSLGGVDLSAMTGAMSGASAAALGSGGGGSGLATIISDDVEVVFSVETTVYVHMQVDQEVQILVDAYPGQVFTGSVARLAPTADSIARRFEVTVAPDDPDHQLRPGMFVTVALEVE
jgi:HlyD family secretion protein